MNYRKKAARKPNRPRTEAEKAARRIPGAVMGRPSIYTEELGKEICAKIAAGASLRSVCEAEGMPDRHTVLDWLWGGKLPDFAAQYARACDERGHWLAEDALRIADQPVRRVKGHMDNAEVQDKRLKVDTRKWFASKLAPKAFGDRVQTEVTGAGGAPLAVTLTEVNWDKLIARVSGATTGNMPEEPPAAPVEPGPA